MGITWSPAATDDFLSILKKGRGTFWKNDCHKGFQ